MNSARKIVIPVLNIIFFLSLHYCLYLDVIIILVCLHKCNNTLQVCLTFSRSDVTTFKEKIEKLTNSTFYQTDTHTSLSAYCKSSSRQEPLFLVSMSSVASTFSVLTNDIILQARKGGAIPANPNNTRTYSQSTDCFKMGECRTKF